MNSRSRSSRIKSLANNDESIYWPAIDTFPNVTNSTRPASRQSFNMSRNYIDPWDLENYAYIQSLQSEEPIATPTTTINDNIYYPPKKYHTTDVDDCPCYAGLDEQLFYNAKYEVTDDGTFTDMEETSSNSYNGSTLSTLQMKNNPHINFPPPPMHPSSAYECYNSIVIPNQSQNGQSTYETGFSYPSSELIYESLPIDYSAPPPPPPPRQQIYYDPYSTDSYRRPSRRSIHDPCYECLEMQNMPVYYAPSNLREQYDSINHNDVDYKRGPHLERFGLSKKGLLQIDYSVSWSNLQRFIASK